MRFLLLDDKDLRGHSLNLCHNIGRDELLQVNAANVAEETELELLELELSKIEVLEKTDGVELEDGLKLLELEERGDIKILGLEEILEAEDVEVVELSKVTEQLEVQRVEHLQVVQVDLVEAVQVVETSDIEGSPLLSRGGNSQGGEEGGKDGRGLHFVGWCGKK